MQQHLTIDETVKRLESRGYTVKQSGDTYRSQCPAHGGKDANLAFSLGQNGQAVFTCHSHHCTYEEIMNALDVEKSPSPKRQTAFGKTLHPTFERAVQAAGFGAGQQRPPDFVYRYNNADGSENFSIIRWNTDNGKITRPISKVDGGYIVGARSDCEYPIYRLTEIVQHLQSSDASARIYICEGEKATDAAVSIGLQVTTSAFGINSAHKTNWAELDNLALKHGKKLEIVIFPDNDKPGAEYAESLAGIFTKFKSSPIVKIVPFADFGSITGIENFPEGGDFYDLLEHFDGKAKNNILTIVETMVDTTLPETEIVAEPLEWEPFPVDLLPKNIARLCKEAAMSKNIEPVYVGIHALAAVSSVAGSAYKVVLKNDWLEPAIIWTCLVCESGSGKTPGLDSAIAPLRFLQKQADDAYDVNCRTYESDKADYDLQYDEWKRNRKRSQSDVPEKTKEPVAETFLVDDATLEAIAEVLENNPFGILLLKDELAGWFNSFDCYRSGSGGKDLPSWLSIHGGSPFRINRKTGKKVIRADNPAMSLCGGIQPNVLFRIVKSNEDFFDSGLTARILFAMPPDKPSQWTELETSEEAVAGYENIFRTLWQWRRDTEKPNPDTPLLVKLSPDAKEQFVRFYNANSLERCDLTGDMKASWAKFTGYAARLALVFHIVQRIEDGGSMGVLQGDSMQRAIRLIDWFKRETIRILGFLRKSADGIDDELQSVLSAVEENGGLISPRELQRRRNRYRDGINRAAAILDKLVENKKLTVVKEKAGNGKLVKNYSSATTSP